MTDEESDSMKNRAKLMTDNHLCLSIQLTRLGVERHGATALTVNWHYY